MGADTPAAGGEKKHIVKYEGRLLYHGGRNDTNRNNNYNYNNKDKIPLSGLTPSWEGVWGQAPFPRIHVENNSIPLQIMQEYRDVTLSVDIMSVYS